MARVRVVQKVLYAEAVKKVEEDGSRVRDPERIPVSSRFVPAQRDRPTNYLCFSKVVLVFISMVINCTTELKRKSQKIDVVAAAEMYLTVRNVTSEEFQGVLRGGVPSSQAVCIVH